jgi:hypothetical protein
LVDAGHVCHTPRVDEASAGDPHPCQVARVRFNSVEKFYLLLFGRMSHLSKITYTLQPQVFLLKVYHKGSNWASMKDICIRIFPEALFTRAKTCSGIVIVCV